LSSAIVTISATRESFIREMCSIPITTGLLMPRTIPITVTSVSAFEDLTSFDLYTDLETGNFVGIWNTTERALNAFMNTLANMGARRKIVVEFEITLVQSDDDNVEIDLG
jgi:hypothetical protein